MLRVCALASVIVLLACGSRSALPFSEAAERRSSLDAGFDASVAVVDAGETDPGETDAGTPPGLPPPDCGVDVPVGSIRGTIDRVFGPTVIDDAGNFYVAREGEGDTEILASFDACLRPRWERPIDVRVRSNVAMFMDWRGDLWIEESQTITRIHEDGEYRPAELEFRGTLFQMLGAPDATGPVFVTSTGVYETTLLYRTDSELEGEYYEHHNQPDGSEYISSYLFRGECALHRNQVACYSTGYSLDPLAQLWRYPGNELVDGTHRHVYSPAFLGDHLYTVRHGISTYDLIGVNLATGERDIRTRLMRTTRGQVDVRIGPPIVAPGDLIVIYATGHRDSGGPDGQLMAYHGDGELAWTFPAARTRLGDPNGGGIWSGDSTHAAGEAGLVYLAMGETVYAVDTENGELAWQLFGLGDVNQPWLNLSPNGDLVVQSLEGTLFVIATESRGLAATDWPISGGSHRRHLAHN